MKIEDLVVRLVDAGGSDLYLKVGVPPAIRAHGELMPTDLPLLTADDTERLARQVLPPVKMDVLARTGDTEAARSFDGLGRYRINAYSQRGMIGLVLRRVVTTIPSFRALGLPPVVRALAEEVRGLILVTGPSGTGKTTTIASIIGHINRIRRWHIVTLEDPIEVIHADGRCLIDQREVGSDIPSYEAGLKYVVRQDPDLVFIGEIRDEQTAEAALRAAETGHLVISTLHTIDATETVNRLIDLYPATRQRHVRRALAGSLRGVISQRLVRRSGGQGRIPAVEVLVVNGRVADEIIEPGQVDAIVELIETGRSYGMQSFDQSLVDLVRRGLVDLEDAQQAATNPHDLALALTSSHDRDAVITADVS
jgi:twitching motility protein PilT